MKRHILTSVLSVLMIAGVFALEVDEEEIKRTGSDTIEFINYTGPHKVIDSLEAIKSIGSDLGKAIGKNVSDYSTSGNSAKYSVIHAVDSTKGKLDADIIIIGSDATVDHITNLRRIISAYLSSSYGYSTQDADTLAVFVTVYNAVYRGNKSYFSTKYKDIVLNNLTSNCGLSVNYKDWPGKSEIVIPLFDVKDGGLSTVDTSVISDTKVVDSMKDDDDRNVDSRKDMVDLKEREAEAASEKAKDSQKTAVAEQKKLDDQKKTTETAKKEAETAKQVAEEKKEIAQQNPDDKKAQEEAKEAEKDAEEKQQIADEEEEKLAEQEEKTEEAKQEAKEQQEVADKKQSEAQSERKEIAKDQQIVQEKEAQAANADSDYGLIISDDSAMLSRLVKYNKDTGEVIKNSPVSVLRNRTIYKVEDGYLAIAGESVNNGTVKLVILDSESMEIISESSEVIADNSVLVQDGNEYYCIVNDNGIYYTAKFDEKLTLKLKSDVQALNCTPITVNEDCVVITNASGRLQLLNKKDLKALNSTQSATTSSTTTTTTSMGYEK